MGQIITCAPHLKSYFKPLILFCFPVVVVLDDAAGLFFLILSATRVGFHLLVISISQLARALVPSNLICKFLMR